jgi:hypothetical protein
MSGDARLAHFYHAFGMAFLRRCYYQILGPRRHLPELADSLGGHCNARFHLNPHMSWQATKSYVQRANAFGLVLHGFLPFRLCDLTLRSSAHSTAVYFIDDFFAHVSECE